MRTLLLLLLFSCIPTIGRAQATTPPDDHDMQNQLGGLSNLILRAFGSVHWGDTDYPVTPNSFALGQLDLFMTSRLNEHVSVLAEIVLESSTTTRVITDLERLQLTYRMNDHFVVSAGRYHTGIGYYNTAFHHGAYFETAIGRPRVFAFEDEGGVLPVHEVGLSMHGLVPKTASSLHYLFEVGNGRRWDQEEEEGEEGPAVDSNDAKSTNVGLSYRPDAWRGFEAGGSFYRDDILARRGQTVSHQIGAAFVTYRTPSVEILAEWLALVHSTAGLRKRNDEGYLQASMAWGKWRPYYRYDRLVIDPRTPFIGTIESSTGHTLGLRVDPAEWVGLKAQYERGTRGSVRGVDAVGVQLVFVF